MKPLYNVKITLTPKDEYNMNVDVHINNKHSELFSTSTWHYYGHDSTAQDLKDLIKSITKVAENNCFIDGLFRSYDALIKVSVILPTIFKTNSKLQKTVINELSNVQVDYADLKQELICSEDTITKPLSTIVKAKIFKCAAITSAVLLGVLLMSSGILFSIQAIMALVLIISTLLIFKR